ncbi:hypothetical protein DSECCO2_646360 [anaerobic digester metagenome]
MAFGNFQFFFLCVAAQVNDFHTVAQCGMNGRQIVGGCNKKYSRQVIIDLEIIIVESIVLLRIKHFEQRCLRVALHGVSRYLVDFIQHKNRIRRFHFFQVLNNSSGKRTDVGFAVAPQFGFVAQTTQ